MGMAVARCAFLAGGTSLLAACAVQRAQLSSIVHHCGSPQALPNVTSRPVEYGTFVSKVLNSRVGFAIARPPGEGRLLGIAYALPGRGATAAMLFPALGHDKYLASLAREPNFPPFAVAAVDSGESYWHHRAGGEDRMAMFAMEFSPLVHRLLNLGPGTNESLLGYSMGGYGALLAAIREPHRYRAVAVAGPAIWRSFEEQHTLVPDAFDDRADFDKNSVFASASALLGQAVRIDCGRSDPFAPNVEVLSKALPRAIVSVRAGCHDDTLFRSAVADQLRFIASRIT